MRKRTADNKEQRDYGEASADLGKIQNYEKFLLELRKIFEQVYDVMKPKSYCCVIVMDIRKKNHFYPYHMDISQFMQEIGFSLPHKQAILEEFIENDKEDYPNKTYNPCVGKRKIKQRKSKDDQERDEKLDDRLKGKHFNAYWQICKKLGCPRTRKTLEQKGWQFEGQQALEEVPEDEI